MRLYFLRVSSSLLATSRSRYCVWFCRALKSSSMSPGSNVYVSLLEAVAILLLLFASVVLGAFVQHSLRPASWLFPLSSRFASHETLHEIACFCAMFSVNVTPRSLSPARSFAVLSVTTSFFKISLSPERPRLFACGCVLPLCSQGRLTPVAKKNRPHFYSSRRNCTLAKAGEPPSRASSQWKICFLGGTFVSLHLRTGTITSRFYIIPNIWFRLAIPALWRVRKRGLVATIPSVQMHCGALFKFFVRAKPRRVIVRRNLASVSGNKNGAVADFLPSEQTTDALFCCKVDFFPCKSLPHRRFDHQVALLPAHPASSKSNCLLNKLLLFMLLLLLKHATMFCARCLRFLYHVSLSLWDCFACLSRRLTFLSLRSSLMWLCSLVFRLLQARYCGLRLFLFASPCIVSL